jgi:hypothetical protein
MFHSSFVTAMLSLDGTHHDMPDNIYYATSLEIRQQKYDDTPLAAPPLVIYDAGMRRVCILYA